MYNLLVLFLLIMSDARTQVLNVTQAQDLRHVSVVIHAKESKIDKKTLVLKYGMVGCSGTYIGPTTILTAAHCFEYNTLDVWVRGPGEHSRHAVVVKIDPKLDLALLSVEGPLNHKYAKIARSSRPGEAVITVGSPLGFEFLLSEGIVATLRDKEKEFKGTYLIHTAMINSGSSGGGAFNDKEQLLGVNTMTVGGFFGWAGISMAVDADTIRGFLR